MCVDNFPSIFSALMPYQNVTKNRSVGDTGDGVSNLVELLDEGS
jgi:hypothetical protein